MLLSLEVLSTDKEVNYMGKMKNFDDDKSDPPPYEEISNIDEFEVDRPSIVPLAPIQNKSILVSPISPQPLSTLSNSASIQGKEESANYQHDVFKKPPKFLLYPSMSMPEKESPEDLGKFGGRDHRPSSGGIQRKIQPTTPNFIVAQPQPVINTGVTMSPSQLPDQVNVPVHSYVTDNYLPRYSHRMVCPRCKKAVSSMVQYVSGQLTHLVALAACWFTCCLVCVPYFIDDLKDAEHICPECGGILGYNRKKVF